MNGIENYPAAGENFLENVILKVSQTHFSKDFYPKGGIHFSRGGQCPPGGGAVKYPVPAKTSIGYKIVSNLIKPDKIPLVLRYCPLLSMLTFFSRLD